MMKPAFWRFLLLTASFLRLTHFGFAQRGKTESSFIDTTSDFSFEWKSVNIGFPEEDISEDDIPYDSIIRMYTISDSDFGKYAKRYSSKILMDTSMITRTDTSFTIQEGHFKRTFPAFRIWEGLASTYEGLIAPLNLYIVNTVDMQNETAGSVLIDRQTGKMFPVPFCSDAGPRQILLSPNNSFLLSYDNSYFENDNCCVFLQRVNRSKAGAGYSLNNYLNLNFDRLNILKLVWVNENCFAMKVSEQMNPNDSEEGNKIGYYLKITLLRQETRSK